VTVIAGLRRFARRHRLVVGVVGALASVILLTALLSARRGELATALTSAPWWTLTLAAVLQVVALLSRAEAWHLTIAAAGGRVRRRTLFRASSAQVLGSLLNGQLGAAVRIVALRRFSPALCPQVPTLIAAELPILAVEAALAALTSFTLVGPLGLPWWSPIIAAGLVIVGGAGLRRLALCTGRELWRGLAVIRSARGGGGADPRPRRRGHLRRGGPAHDRDGDHGRADLHRLGGAGRAVGAPARRGPAAGRRDRGLTASGAGPPGPL
jgi:uncharacterized membrane protein YbhN (UPF0104 family)